MTEGITQRTVRRQNRSWAVRVGEICGSGVVAGETSWGWTPRDGNAHLEVRGPGVSSQDTSRHICVHVHTSTCK